MKRIFKMILGLDVALLVLPARGLGPQGEFWIAATLAAATAVLWICLKVAGDNSDRWGER